VPKDSTFRPHRGISGGALEPLGCPTRVVELIGTIAAYNMVSRFVVATGVDLE
jgi:hypothetical protein